MPFSETEKTTLLVTARNAILSGIDHGLPAAGRPSELPASLCALHATFVTLKSGPALRGCIGTLDARSGLLDSVAENAYAAAFRDPRFTALTRAELDRLSIEISVLDTPRVVSCASEAELLAAMARDKAGWIVREHDRQATFLPSVWPSFEEPADFLAALRQKAGLGTDYWSDSMVFSRYATTVFAAAFVDIPPRHPR